MKCPYCGNEMEEGFIPVGHMILQWLPKEEEYPKSATKISKNGIKLSKFPISPIKTTSYYCKDCKNIIIPVKEDL